MDDADTPAMSPAAASPIFPADDFSVQLRFELDQTDVPLARLQAVQQGGVLPLQDRDGALPVRIIAGGAPSRRARSSRSATAMACS